MLIAFSPIFVADTKIVCVYDFVAPLKELPNCSQKLFLCSAQK